MKKKVIFWIISAMVLIAINGLILQKERLLKNGKLMLLPLAPVDPRSLMQGDYMILRYQIAGQVNSSSLKNEGNLVVRLDKDSVAHWVKLEDGTDLAEDEQLLFYRNRNGIRLGAESFFFQEGQADLYEKAKYGELRVQDTGKSILIGLRDKDFNPLGKRLGD